MPFQVRMKDGIAIEFLFDRQDLDFSKNLKRNIGLPEFNRTLLDCHNCSIAKNGVQCTIEVSVID